MSDHVKLYLKKDKRALVTQLTLGVLQLQIELGRYQNIVRDLRICKLCNQEVESELHFLLRCSKLECIRTTLGQDLSCPGFKHLNEED